jgi:hypothetical protein
MSAGSFFVETLTFETLTIAELGDPLAVSHVLRICDESGAGFRGKPICPNYRDAACRVSRGETTVSIFYANI